MKRYLGVCLLVLAAVVAGCSSNSDFADNGTLTVTAGSTTLTPGGGTTVSAKYTITTNVQIALAGNDVTFSSSRPDLVAFTNATVKSDGTGAAATGLTIISTALVPAGGVDAVVTVSFRGLASNVVIHVNPGTVAGPTLNLTVPAAVTAGTSFAVTAQELAGSNAVVGKNITFASSSNLISFFSTTAVTDGTGTATTVASVNSTMSIPAAGMDVTLSATDGTLTALKVVHVNPAVASANTIAITAPATVTSGSSFTVTAQELAGSSAVVGKSITFSATSSLDTALVKLISPVPATAATDGTGTAITVATVNSTVIIPAGGVDVTLSATDGTVSTLKVVHINPSTTTSSSIALTIPATANLGSSFAVTAVLTPAVTGDPITFTSSNPVITFAPVSATTNGSGSVKSIATVNPSAPVPQNGLDVTVTASDGTVSDYQVVHVNGTQPASFSIFPTSLDISNIASNTTKQIQIVKPSTVTSYNYSAASRAPFIIDVQSVNNTNGIITLITASSVTSCSNLGVTTHTGTVIIEIKDDSASNVGSTLYYPVTYSLCW